MNTLFSFNGRLGSSTYQNRFIISLAIGITGLLVYEFISLMNLEGDSMNTAAFLIALLCTGVTFLSTLASSIYRLHDLDRPAWHLLLFLIPLYNIYLFTSLLCIKGEEEVNRFGLRPEPLQH